MKPFTIKTFFPTGDPDGLRISEFTNGTIQAFYIPRNDINQAIDERKELEWNGVYTLFDDNYATSAYIGEAENVGNRLKQHVNSKESWWKIAVAFVVNTQSHQLSKADIKFVENLMYQKAKQTNNMKLHNGNTPHQSFVNESRKYDLTETFNDINLLLRSLGFPLFVPTSQQKRQHLITLYLDNRSSNAVGNYNLKDKSITVLAGSKLSELEPNHSFKRVKLLDELINAGVIVDNQFVRDYKFTSLSGAASLINKASSSGPHLWHDQNRICVNDLNKKPNVPDKNHLLYLKLRGANAKATYNPKTNELTVLASSKLAVTKTNSFHQQKLLDKLCKSKIIVNNQFVKNYTFSSPSTAASIVCKSSMNGKTTWLRKDGANLKEIIKQSH